MKDLIEGVWIMTEYQGHIKKNIILSENKVEMWRLMNQTTPRQPLKRLM